MRTVLFEEVDGHKVILGFSHPVIDPIATQRAAAEKMMDTELYSEYRATWEPEKRKELAAQLCDRVRQFFHTSPVFFRPTNGEEIIENKEFEELQRSLKTLAKNEKLTREGKVIEDNRGRIYWTQELGTWLRSTVCTLGEGKPATAIWGDELSSSQAREIEEQLETDRIRVLSPEDRAIEMRRKLEEASEMAVMMRMRCEVQGDEKALEKARAWLIGRETEIRGRYGD